MSTIEELERIAGTLFILSLFLLFPWLPFSSTPSVFDRKFGRVNVYRIVWVVPLFYSLSLVGSYLLFGRMDVSAIWFHLFLLIALFNGISSIPSLDGLPSISHQSPTLLTFVSIVTVVGIIGYYVNDMVETVRYRRVGAEHYLLPLRKIISTDTGVTREKLCRLKRSSSVLVLGNTRSGKTESIKLLMRQLQQNIEDAFVILDAKGDQRGSEGMGQYQEILEANGDDYLQLALGNPSVRWNIFREAPSNDEDQQREVYGRVAQALFQESGKRGANQFFHDAAQQVFTAVLLYLDRTYTTEYPDNEILVQYFRQKSLAEVEQDLKTFPDLQSAAMQLDSTAERMALSVYAHVQQKVQETFRGSFAERGSFSIREYAQEPNGEKLLLNLPQAHADVLEPLYRFFLDWSIQYGLSRTRSESSDASMYFVLDEFSSLPELQHIESLINRGLEYNTRTVVGVQSIAQLYSTYGKEGGNELLSGFSNAIMLRPNDPETVEYMRSRMGKRQFERAVNGDNGGGNNDQTTVEERYPVSEEEAMTLKPGEAYIIRPGQGYLFGYLHQVSEVEHRLGINSIRKSIPLWSSVQDRRTDSQTAIEGSNENGSEPASNSELESSKQ